jgi:hypothetical protein
MILILVRNTLMSMEAKMEDDHHQEVEAKQVINNLKLEQNKVLCS